MCRLLFAALAFTALTALIACGKSESSIRDEIAAANHCEQASDCVDVGGTCPFGCYIVVHKDEADHIRGLLADYQSNCAYGCVAKTGVDCTGGTCLVRTSTR